MSNKLKFFLLILSAGLFFLRKSSLALAQGYQLQVPLPGVSGTVSGPGQYIRAIFTYGLSIVGIAALWAIVIGGFKYLRSGGSETRKTSGKEWIWGAVIGLVLMLCSWLILNTINPELTSLEEPSLQKIAIKKELWEPAVPTSSTPVGPNGLPSKPGTTGLPGSIRFKDGNTQSRFDSRAPESLRQALANSPVPLYINSYDQGGHASGSQHFLGNAVDISTRYLTPEQTQQALEYFRSLPQTNQILHGGMPQYNTINGQPYSNPKYNSSHMNHIHYAAFPQ